MVRRQSLMIQLQNVIDCLRFLMRYTDFWENQTYQLSHIYNQKEDQVYNEMYTYD